MLNKINNAKCRYIKTKWYCSTENGLWEQSDRLLFLEINNLAKYYNVYMYLDKTVSDFKRTSHNFKTDLISEFSYVLVDDKIEFNSNKYLLEFESIEYDLQHH